MSRRLLAVILVCDVMLAVALSVIGGLVVSETDPLDDSVAQAVRSAVAEAKAGDAGAADVGKLTFACEIAVNHWSAQSMRARWGRALFWVAFWIVLANAAVVGLCYMAASTKKPEAIA